MSAPQLDLTRLTPEQRDKLDAYNASQKQLTTLTDIADMVQEITTQLDDKDKDEGKKLGALLIDIRESINALNAKEAPESPDYAKPVVEAVSKLEKALGAAIKSIDVKPVLDAPQVNVSPPRIDLKGIEKILKSDIPKAFQSAIKAMPKVELPENDNQPVISKLDDVVQWLESIDTASRMKPLPGNMKVTNPDGSAISGPATVPTAARNGSVTVVTAGTRVQLPTVPVKSVTIKADVANTGIIYIGTSTVTSANGFELSAGESVSADIANIDVFYVDASANSQMVTYLGVL